MSSDTKITGCAAGLSPDLLLKVAGFPACAQAHGADMAQARFDERKKLRREVLKRIEFDETVSEKTLGRLEAGYKGILKKLMRSGAKPDLAELEDAVGALVGETSVGVGTPVCMAGLKGRTQYMYGHSIRCGIIASNVAAGLSYGEEDTRDFAAAMIFHDIGMTAVPEELLMKRDQSPEEISEIEKHSELGAEILKNIPGMSLLPVIVAYGHHLLAGGGGYPEGIDFGTLPQIAKMAAVIDNFEALTAERPQRDALTPAEAVKELTNNRNRYDPEALEDFLRAIGVFPVNTYLKLDTGEVGVVVRNNEENPALPMIKLLLDPVGRPYAKEILIDTMNDTGRRISGEI